MMRLPASVFFLLLSYLASSEGALSPPLNLTVDLLDFLVSVHWLPGPGNPTGTRYSVEFIDIQYFSKPVWNQSANCTDVTSTHCVLILDQMFKDYFVRVQAKWKEERSNWTSLTHSFQLYKDTKLSPPSLTVVSDRRSDIQINLSHWIQSVWNVSLSFSIDLFQMTPNHTAQLIGQRTSRGSLPFSHLPSGYRYCINASAFYTQMSHQQSFNATECVSLDKYHTRGIVHIVGVGVVVVILLLLIIPAGIVLSAKSCYVRDNFIPKALQFIEETAKVLTLSPEEPQALSVSIVDHPHAVQPMDEVDDDTPQEYFKRIRYLRIGIRPESDEHLEEAGFPPAVEEMLPYRNSLYSSAVNMEETEELSTQEEQAYHGCLTQGNLNFSDISLTSSLQNAIFDNAHQIIKAENLLSLYPDLDDEEDSELQLHAYSSTCRLKTFESPEDDSDSLYEENFTESNYEPRPDPQFFLSQAAFQFRS